MNRVAVQHYFDLSDVLNFLNVIVDIVDCKTKDQHLFYINE